MSFSNESTFDEPKTNSIVYESKVSSSQNIPTTVLLSTLCILKQSELLAKFAYTSYSFQENGIMLQKYQYYASIISDAPDIVLCSKLCRHNPTDPTLRSSFLLNAKKECGVYGLYKHQAACTIKDLLTEAVSDHLNGCYKTTYTGVEAEWKLRLYRSGLFLY